jgi:hypothetical protein
MRIVDGIGSDSTIKAYHCRESVGGPSVLVLRIDDIEYEFYCSTTDLKRLIDALQSAYNNSKAFEVI